MRHTGIAIHTVVEEELYLLPEKAIYWKSRQSLLVADLHLGKSGHFRKSGIPVPSAVHHHDLQRLSAVFEKFPVTTVYLLGDLFHSIHNNEWEYFSRWRRQYPQVEMHLVKGNHDVLDDQLISEVHLQLHHESLVVAPFFFSHQPVENLHPEQYCFYGHLHPAVKLRGKGLQSLTFPCFSFGKKSAVLPAFGGFTGSVVRQPVSTDKVYIIYNNMVKPVTDLGIKMR